MSLGVLACILCIIGYASLASGDPWSDSGFLQRGQAALHQVQVDSSAMFKLTSPPGSRFTLYAMQVETEGVQSCPSETAIRGMALFKSPDSLVLPSGQWCVEVYASQGSGKYYLEYVTPTPDPIPSTIQPTTPMAPISPASSIPSKVSSQTATISLKSPNVHSYLVSGERTFLEWILEPSDCTTSVDIPEAMMTTQHISDLQSAVCSLDLNAYLYKDCDPRSEQCTPIAFDESSSPYAYIGIPYPQDKSKYYLLAKSVEGAGSYTLTSRSYVQAPDPKANEKNNDVTGTNIKSGDGTSAHSRSFSSSSSFFMG